MLKIVSRDSTKLFSWKPRWLNWRILHKTITVFLFALSVNLASAGSFRIGLFDVGEKSAFLFSFARWDFLFFFWNCSWQCWSWPPSHPTHPCNGNGGPAHREETFNPIGQVYERNTECIGWVSWPKSRLYFWCWQQAASWGECWFYRCVGHFEKC